MNAENLLTVIIETCIDNKIGPSRDDIIKIKTLAELAKKEVEYLRKESEFWFDHFNGYDPDRVREIQEDLKMTKAEQ